MPKRILIADDEESLVATLSFFLKSRGFEVVTAEDGMEALAKARSENVALILLDLMMPKMDGYNVCRMLKFDKNYQHIPIILLSAKSAQSDKDFGKEVHADAYFSKPYDREALVDKINELIA